MLGAEREPMADNKKLEELKAEINDQLLKAVTAEQVAIVGKKIKLLKELEK
jgi:hypothetical protein